MDSDLDELVTAMNDYEWENPIMPGDMMMQALGFLIVLFFGRVFSDVLETEKNFAEIIDIINESMIITGTDDENLKIAVFHQHEMDSLRLSDRDGLKTEIRKTINDRRRIDGLG